MTITLKMEHAMSPKHLQNRIYRYFQRKNTIFQLMSFNKYIHTYKIIKKQTSKKNFFN